MRHLYAAYGSNMDPEAMKRRSPNARLVGTGWIDGYQLEFCTHATIVPATGRRVEVAIFQLGEGDEERLDLYEGFPSYYRKEDLWATLDDGHETPVKVTAYVMNNGSRRYPMNYYLAGIFDSYERFGFDKQNIFDALDRIEGKEV